VGVPAFCATGPCSRAGVRSPPDERVAARDLGVRYLAALREQLPAGQALRVEYGADHDDSMRRLLDGRAGAFVMDRVLLAARLAWAPGGAGSSRAGLAITPWSVAPQSLECYAVALRERDTELKRIADTVIGELLEGPPFEALYARWFKQPIAPPRAVVERQGVAAARSLDLPLPAGLRERLADPRGQACATGRADPGAPR